MEPERSLTPITELTTPASLRTVRLPFFEDDDLRSPFHAEFPDERDEHAYAYEHYHGHAHGLEREHDNDGDVESGTDDSHYSNQTVRDQPEHADAADAAHSEDHSSQTETDYRPDPNPTFVPLAPLSDASHTSPPRLPEPIMSPPRPPPRRAALPPGAEPAALDGGRSLRPAGQPLQVQVDIPGPMRSAVTPVFPDVAAKPFPMTSAPAAAPKRSGIPVPTRTLDAKGTPAAPVVHTAMSPDSVGPRTRTSSIPRPRVSSGASAAGRARPAPLTEANIYTAQAAQAASVAKVVSPRGTPLAHTPSTTPKAHTPATTPKAHTPAATPTVQSPLTSPRTAQFTIPAARHSPVPTFSTLSTYGPASEEARRRYADRYSAQPTGETRRLSASSTATAPVPGAAKPVTGNTRRVSMTAVPSTAKAPSTKALGRSSTQVMPVQARQTAAMPKAVAAVQADDFMPVVSDSESGPGMAGVGARSTSRPASVAGRRSRPSSFYGTKHDGEEVWQQIAKAGAVDPNQLQAALQAEQEEVKPAAPAPQSVVHGPNDPANNVKHPIWVKPIYTSNLLHPTLHNVPVLDYDAEAELHMKTSRLPFKRTPKDRTKSNVGGTRPSSLYVPNGRTAVSRARPNSYHGAYDTIAPTPLVTTPTGTPPDASGFDLSVLGRPTSLFSHEMTSYRIAGSPALSRNNSSADVAGMGATTPTNISRGVSAADLPALRRDSRNNSMVDVSQPRRDSFAMARGGSAGDVAAARSSRNASVIDLSTIAIRRHAPPITRALSAVDMSSLRPDTGNVIPDFPPSHTVINFPPPPSASPPPEPAEALEAPAEPEPVPDAVVDADNSAPESPGVKTPEPILSPPASPRIGHVRRNSKRVGSIIATMFGSKDVAAPRSKSKSRRSSRSVASPTAAQSSGPDDLVGAEPPRTLVRNATSFGIKDDGSDFAATPPLPSLMRQRTNSGSVVEFATRRPLYVENVDEHAIDDDAEEHMADVPLAKEAPSYPPGLRRGSSQAASPMPSPMASVASLDLKPGQVYRPRSATPAQQTAPLVETLAPVMLDAQGNLTASPASSLGLVPGEPAVTPSSPTPKAVPSANPIDIAVARPDTMSPMSSINLARSASRVSSTSTRPLPVPPTSRPTSRPPSIVNGRTASRPVSLAGSVHSHAPFSSHGHGHSISHLPRLQPSAMAAQSQQPSELPILIASHLLSTHAAALMRQSEAMRDVGETMRRMASESLDWGGALVGLASPVGERPAPSSLGQVAESPEYDGLPATSHPYSSGAAALSSASLGGINASGDRYSPSPPRPTVSRMSSRSLSSIRRSALSPPSSSVALAPVTTDASVVPAGASHPSSYIAANFLREADRLGKEGWASLRQAEEVWSRAMGELRGIVENPAALQAHAGSYVPGSSIYNSNPPGLGLRAQAPAHKIEASDATARDATIRAGDLNATIRASVAASAAQSRVSLPYGADYGSTASLPPQWMYPQPASESGSASDSKDGAGVDVKVRAAMSTTAVDRIGSDGSGSPRARKSEVPPSFAAAVGGGYSADQLKMRYSDADAKRVSVLSSESSSGSQPSRKLSKRRPSDSGGRRWFGLRKAEIVA